MCTAFVQIAKPRSDIALHLRQRWRRTEGHSLPLVQPTLCTHNKKLLRVLIKEELKLTPDRIDYRIMVPARCHLKGPLRVG